MRDQVQKRQSETVSFGDVVLGGVQRSTCCHQGTDRRQEPGRGCGDDAAVVGFMCAAPLVQPVGIWRSGEAGRRVLSRHCETASYKARVGCPRSMQTVCPAM